MNRCSSQRFLHRDPLTCFHVQEEEVSPWLGSKLLMETCEPLTSGRHWDANLRVGDGRASNPGHIFLIHLKSLYTQMLNLSIGREKYRTVLQFFLGVGRIYISRCNGVSRKAEDWCSSVHCSLSMRSCANQPVQSRGTTWSAAW